MQLNEPNTRQHPPAAAACLLLTLCAFAPLHSALGLDSAATASQVVIPAGSFESVLPPAAGVKTVKMASYRLDRTPVTNEQFASFVRQHPEWQRGQATAVFVDDQYLQHWQAPTEPGSAALKQPVVHVSWFAASAYCEARGARLPTWYEWEFAAAASYTARDARSDPHCNQQILDWYSRSARSVLPDVGKTKANYYGVQDLHGVIWEWVDDLGSMLVSGDNRQQSETDELKFCGPGALTMEQKENYATLMRIAMLSSMQARYTSSTMGFRCATPVEGDVR